MLTRLLFITSHYFYQPTVDALKRLNLSCETTVIPYDNFTQILSVYQQNINQFDACLVSGIGAKRAIEMGFPNIAKPLVYFQVSANGLHRDILRLAVEKQSLDFSRIAIDFMIPLGCGCFVSDYITMEDPEVVFHQNQDWVEAVTPTSGSADEIILQKVEALWNQKAIDLVICQYSSNVPALSELGIPFLCPFLSDHHFRQIIEQTMMKVELARLHNNHPAIIQVFPRHPCELTETQVEHLCQHVRQFLRQNLIDCVIQNNGNCCVIITSLQILKFLTDNFQICRISSYLEEFLDFSPIVAYGVGNSLHHAMNNVQIASKEANILSKPFIVDSNGSLIGPLNSEKRQVIAPNSLPDVSDIAKRCSLSSMTIQKLITIIRNTGSDKMTTQDLAAKLDTTQRNANRIMQNLCKGHVAKPVYTQTSHSRGRPIQVYTLDFGTFVP